MKKWYSNTKPDARQGLISEESTGKTIAVSYDPKDAALIASAPDLVFALSELASSARTFRNVPDDAQQWTSFDEERLQYAFNLLANLEGAK